MPTPGLTSRRADYSGRRHVPAPRPGAMFRRHVSASSAIRLTGGGGPARAGSRPVRNATGPAGKERPGRCRRHEDRPDRWRGRPRLVRGKAGEQPRGAACDGPGGDPRGARHGNLRGGRQRGTAEMQAPRCGATAKDAPMGRRDLRGGPPHRQHRLRSSHWRRPALGVVGRDGSVRSGPRAGQHVETDGLHADPPPSRPADARPLLGATSLAFNSGSGRIASARGARPPTRTRRRLT